LNHRDRRILFYKEHHFKSRVSVTNEMYANF
jgi:hypothetical protein